MMKFELDDQDITISIPVSKLRSAVYWVNFLDETFDPKNNMIATVTDEKAFAESFVEMMRKKDASGESPLMLALDSIIESCIEEKVPGIEFCWSE